VRKGDWLVSYSLPVNGISLCAMPSSSTRRAPWGSSVWGQRWVTYSETALDPGWRTWNRESWTLYTPLNSLETCQPKSSNGHSPKALNEEKEMSSDAGLRSGVSNDPWLSLRTLARSPQRDQEAINNEREFVKRLKQDLGGTRTGWLYRWYMAMLQEKSTAWQQNMVQRKEAYRG
jgi:hypothetical protein